MSAFNSMLILIAAFLAVFFQAAMNGLVGAQIDLLPALMVYAGLTAGPGTVALLGFCGGLWFDSLSANPLGISVLPLLIIGGVILERRDLILRHQSFAHFVLGVAASLGAPAITLLLLLTAGHKPVLGLGTLWQLIVMALVGGAATPALFRLFVAVTRLLDYGAVYTPSFRPDREIRRGRN